MRGIRNDLNMEYAPISQRPCDSAPREAVPHTLAIAALLRSAPQEEGGVGAAPGCEMLVPWPGRSVTRDPAADTRTLPRSTNTPNVPALGPAKKRVPRTEISANGLWIEKRDGVLCAGRSYRIGPDC